tara:strand:+ start:353 stop:1090 length:738 start_codon:yes stop_codon:yes gene_type:complete
MALAASGSISLSQIQAEWGGSNPISLSEYYNGSLQANTNIGTISPTVSSRTHTITTGIGKSATSYTVYVDGWGHAHTYPEVTFADAASKTSSKLSGRDDYGVGGTIASSGAINMNMFRGTAYPTSTSYTMYSCWRRHASNNNTGGYFQVSVAGHWGSNQSYSMGSTAFGSCPFTYVYTPAEGNTPATYWYASGTSYNGAWTSAGRYMKTLRTTALGNWTEFFWHSSSTSWHGGYSGTQNIQISWA